MFLGSCTSLPIKIVPILYAWNKPEMAERIFFTIRQHSEAQIWQGVLFTFVHKDMCSRFYCLQSLLCMLTPPPLWAAKLNSFLTISRP